MEHERLQELAALHAIGALDGQDAEEFRGLLADCSRLRHELDAFHAVAAGLAEVSLVQPPAQLKARVLEAIGRRPASNRDLLEKLLPSKTDGFAFLSKADAGDWRALPVPGAFYKLLSV